MTVYRIVNKITGKVYVGQTRGTLWERFREHTRYKSGCVVLRSSVNKYGAENFYIEPLSVCADQIEMDWAESYWIDYHNSLVPNGYNLKTGGKEGVIFTDEIRKKISVANTGRKPSLESRLKMSLAHKGKKCPQRGKKWTESHRTKMKIAHKDVWTTSRRADAGKRVTIRNYKQVIDLSSGFVFISAKDAAISTGIIYSTLVNMLNGTNTNKTCLRYI